MGIADYLAYRPVNIRAQAQVLPAQIHHQDRLHYFTSLPGFTSFCGVITANEPS